MGGFTGGWGRWEEEEAFSERFSAFQRSLFRGGKGYINLGEWVGVWGVIITLLTCAGCWECFLCMKLGFQVMLEKSL